MWHSKAEKILYDITFRSRKAGENTASVFCKGSTPSSRNSHYTNKITKRLSWTTLPICQRRCSCLQLCKQSQCYKVNEAQTIWPLLSPCVYDYLRFCWYRSFVVLSAAAGWISALFTCYAFLHLQSWCRLKYNILCNLWATWKCDKFPAKQSPKQCPSLQTPHRLNCRITSTRKGKMRCIRLYRKNIGLGPLRLNGLRYTTIILFIYRIIAFSV